MNYKAILALLLISLAYSCGKNATTKASLVTFVPENTALVISINHIDSLQKEMHSNTVFSKIEKWDSHKKVAQRFSAIKTLKASKSGILCFSKEEKGELAFSYISKTKEQPLIQDSILTKSTEKYTFKTYTIHKTTLEDTSYFSSIVNSTSFLSSSETLVQNFITNQGKEKINATLSSLYQKRNSKKSANIIVSLKKSESIFSSYFKDEFCEKISNYADWVSLDLQIDTEGITFHGISIAREATKNYLSLFKNTNALKNKIGEYAPENTNAIASYTFDNYADFKINQQLFLELGSPTDSIFETVEEIGIIHVKDEKAIVLHTYGAENIYDYLKNYLKETYDYQGNEIIELQDNLLLEKSFAPLVTAKASYYTVIENSFVFSSSKYLLQSIIKNHKKGTTFSHKIIYKSSEKSLAEQSSSLYITDNKHLENLVKKHGANSIYTDFKKSDFSNFSFAMQTVAEAKFHHTNITITPLEKEEKTSNISSLFTYHLDHEITSTPQFVTNHTTKKKEILLQDINNVLYLISRSGKLIWKKELSSAIQGKIHQVDLFKNGRLQFAFTTANQFLVLDRNGKEVSPFNIDFKEGGLNPLAVFDYEKKKEYRFMVTQGKKIAMYNSKGDIVKGFKLTKTSKNILSAPKHFVIKNKDYLVFRLEDGSLKIVNRVGEDRVKVKEKIAFSNNEIYVYKNRFNCTDENGTLHQINTEGKNTKTTLALVKDHGFTTTSNALVYMNDNTLNIKGKKVSLELGVYSKPQILFVHNRMYISVTDIQNQQIYLFNSKAEILPNFPISGSSAIDLADMDNDKKPELVTKNQDNSIMVYKLQ